MEIFGPVSALIVGAIVGALGRLVVPGRQRLGWIKTVLIGIVAALLGTALASLIGFAGGFSFIELFLQIGLAAVGVLLASGSAANRSVAKR